MDGSSGGFGSVYCGRMEGRFFEGYLEFLDMGL